MNFLSWLPYQHLNWPPACTQDASSSAATAARTRSSSAGLYDESLPHPGQHRAATGDSQADMLLSDDSYYEDDHSEVPGITYGQDVK